MNFFNKTARPTPVRPPLRRPEPPPVAEVIADEAPISANSKGTMIALAFILATGFTLTGVKPSELVRYAAIGTGIGLVISIFFDAKRGMRNLQRADLFAILAYYFLTLFEFLFPQPDFDKMIDRQSTITGLIICLIGFAGLLIGRHLFIPKKQPFKTTLTHAIPRAWLLGIFLFAFGIGYSNMLTAVNFDIFKMIDFFMAPRFSQPWSRERLGGWSSLLYELNMLIQLIPPLAGIILARRQRYTVIQLIIVIAIFGLTLFYGFAGGTRNIFLTFLVTFLMGYSLALPPNRNREIIILAGASALFMCFSTYYMLQFRDIGLKNYVQGKWTPPPNEDNVRKTLYVDYNIFSICKLAEFFPKTHEYLGLEIPFQALIRPIPRALWPNKPTGLSMTIEDALNVDGLTLSASFAGEAYMSGGSFAVLAIALFLGGFMGWWGALSSPNNSEIGHLVYASGFFSAVITMRSLFAFTTALLPSLAAIIISYFVVQIIISQARKLINRATAGPRPPVRPGMPMPPRPPMRRP